MNERFYDQGLAFECTQCHACCRHDPGYVFLSEKDLSALCGHFGKSREAFISDYCRWVDLGEGPLLCLLEKANFDCIFWDKGCTVYEARPTQCRSYPFWKSPLSSKEQWKWEARFCPGIGRGKLHTKQEIEAWLKLREDHPPIARRDAE